MLRILIAEDDPEIALLEKDYLEINGFEVDVVADGSLVEERLSGQKYDLLLLDIMLPGKSGYDICREIRDRFDMPILMVTAKTESPDRIRGLGLGADDYIVKPFDPGELVARVKSHLSRFRRLTGEGQANHAPDEADVIRVGDLRIMTRSWFVYRREEMLKFPNREFELLLFLAKNPNIVFSKEALFEKIWGYDYVGDSATVTVHIGRIREKIEDDPSNPTIIETVWGAGYRLNNHRPSPIGSGV
jgi:DNA-binding response OmpR family regulator